MTTLRIIALIACLGALMQPAAAAATKPPLVFAAASTAAVLGAIGRAFEASGKGRVVFSFAASSTLARQIDHGAPAALFISANAAWMDYVARRGRIDASSRIDIAANRLVLVAPSTSSLRVVLGPGLAAALGGGRLAMGDPDHVPAGIYGRQALTYFGAWQEVSPLVVRTLDVRAAVALVARGEVAAAIVYRSDAVGFSGIRQVALFPAASHPPIRYPAALVAGRTDARAFLDFLTAPAARALFKRHGFAPPE